MEVGSVGCGVANLLGILVPEDLIWGPIAKSACFAKINFPPAEHVVKLGCKATHYYASKIADSLYNIMDFKIRVWREENDN